MSGQSTQLIYIFTREAVQKLDKAAIEQYGIPGVILMENAVRNLCDEALRLLADNDDYGKILICCGKGNNGGDGLALARHLHNEGYTVEILLTYDPNTYTGPAESDTNLKICQKMKLNIHTLNENDNLAQQLKKFNLTESDLIVDALLGTGASTAPREPVASIINWINQQPTPVLAVDIPSGLDCDTGIPAGNCCIQADVTVTFVGLKIGYFELDAQQYLGEVVIGDIGAPIELLQQFGEPVDTMLYERDSSNSRTKNTQPQQKSPPRSGREYTK